MDRFLAVEVRMLEDENRMGPGRLTGVLVRYGEKARDRAERILPGALWWQPEGVLLNTMHVREQPFVRVLPFEKDGAVMIDHPLPNSTMARDAAENLRGRVFTGLSVEIRRSTAQSKYVNGERHITKAELIGGALVDESSYPGSVAELRHAQEADSTWPRAETLFL